jgi:diacylglycerol kinase family enzyme
MRTIVVKGDGAAVGPRRDAEAEAGVGAARAGGSGAHPDVRQPPPEGLFSSWGPVDPPKRPVLFVNPMSGGGRAERVGLAERAREHGIKVSVFGPGHELVALVDEALASGADALGVAGGDGSLGVVAAAAYAEGLPFVCVPAGTRNHFARDVGLDREDLIGALEAFTDGVERLIDMARVNGHLFLNNVSLGIYGEAVRHSTYRTAKVRTLLETAREVVGPSGTLTDVRVVDDAAREHRDPVVVLVSNNPYELDRPLAHGTRLRLDSGRLGVVVIEAPGMSLTPGHAWSAAALEVIASGPLHAGIDGEAIDLSPPLEFASLPTALRVRISARQARSLASGGPA